MTFGMLCLIGRPNISGAQPWTAVGSTGIIVSGKPNYDCFDQAIGFFRQPIIPSITSDCLSNPVINPGPRASSFSPGPWLSRGHILLVGEIPPPPPMPSGSARVLYNVVAEPNIVNGNNVALTVRYLLTNLFTQHILVRLIEQPRDPSPSSFAVKIRLSLSLPLPSATSISRQTLTDTAVNCSQPVTLDFGRNAYYVVADISNTYPHGFGEGVYQVALDQANCAPIP